MQRNRQKAIGVWGAVMTPEERMDESPGAATCDWAQDDEGNWGTSCGNLHAFIEDGPSENNHKFCPYCGGRLEVTS